MTLRSKIILGLVMVVLLVNAGPALAQTKVFTGKITEIARGTELDIAKTETFYVIKLEEYPKIKFRMKTDDAERWGVVQKGGVTGVVTPKMSKGMGWRVKLTCDATNYGEVQAPVYKVTSLEHLGD